jgi:hypothetical protein
MSAVMGSWWRLKMEKPFHRLVRVVPSGCWEWSGYRNPDDIADKIKKGRVPKPAHCVHGHPFSADNTYWHRGRRQCRACNRRAALKYKCGGGQ